MPAITAAETRISSAASLLEVRSAADPVPLTTAEIDLLAVEQQRVAAAIGSLVARTAEHRGSAAALDRMTDEIASLLARAETLRAQRARAAARRAGDERLWRDHLDPASF